MYMYFNLIILVIVLLVIVVVLNTIFFLSQTFSFFFPIGEYWLHVCSFGFSAFCVSKLYETVYGHSRVLPHLQ